LDGLTLEEIERGCHIPPNLVVRTRCLNEFG